MCARNFGECRIAGECAQRRRIDELLLGLVQTRASRPPVGTLKQLSRRQGMTLFMTLLAALKILLSRLGGQKDVVVGATIAGRNRPSWRG